MPYKDPEKRREWDRKRIMSGYHRDGQKRRYHERKKMVYDHYGRVCVCCGETEEAFLCIDHVNRDGTQHRKQIGQGAILIHIIKAGFPHDFRVLCQNCNWAEYNNGICPHQVETEQINAE